MVAWLISGAVMTSMVSKLGHVGFENFTTRFKGVDVCYPPPPEKKLQQIKHVLSVALTVRLCKVTFILYLLKLPIIQKSTET